MPLTDTVKRCCPADGYDKRCRINDVSKTPGLKTKTKTKTLTLKAKIRL